MKYLIVYTKIIILVSIFVLIIYRKLVYETSYFSIAENIIIVYFFLDFFFKFKSGSFQSIHKYVRLLKYISILNLLCIVISIYYCNFFKFIEPSNQAIRNSFFRMMSFESYLITQPTYQWGCFYTQLLLYLFYNYFNYTSKLDNIFKKRIV
jgi:hypothetical protein